MERSFYARYAWLIVLVAVLLPGPIIFGARKAFEGMNNNVRQWLPDRAETVQYQEFRRTFGADDFALISWEGCTLDDERLDRLAEALVPPAEKRGDEESESKTECFAKVLTGRQALRTLMAEPFELSRKEALSRLEGVLVGPDHKSTCAIVTLSEIGDTDRRRAVNALADIAVDECGIERGRLRLGGDAVFNAAIDIESEKAVTQWIWLSVLVGLTVAWLCLRRIKLMIIIFFVSAYAVGLGTAAIYYTGGRMNLIMVLVPVLIYVLTLSASVHLANYYRDAVRESGIDGAPMQAVAAGWWPCTLASLTTALGVASLYVSSVVPVKQFGIYSALGVLLSLLSLFVLLPALMELFPFGGGWEKSAEKKGVADRTERLLGGIAGWIVRRHTPVAWLCFLLLISCGVGVAFVQTSIRPARFFPADSKWIQDFEWLNERIGPMITLEVVLYIDKESDMEFLKRMELVRRVEREIGKMDHTHATLSSATFAPPLGGVRVDRYRGRIPARILARRTVLNKRLLANRDVFEEAGYLAEEGDNDLWRITARTQAARGMDYDQILDQVKQRIDEFLRKSGYGSDEVEVVYTGGVPLVFIAQRELLVGLFKSFCTAFVLIAIVMIVLLRNFRAGMIVMLPNVFPILIVFGTMGWTGTLVDVGSMMTASVALGIAVDDTLHFLTWFRRASMGGRSRSEAIGVAYRRCAVAMTQTTLIAGLANVVFVLCNFQPVAQYGLLMFVLLLAALVGDLVFLPAILATGMGKLFVGRQAVKQPSLPPANSRQENAA